MPVATDPAELVPRTYRDASRRIVPVAEASRDAILSCIGDPPAIDPLAIVRPGDALPVPGTVRLEDGSDLGRLEALPADAPIGYHHLVGDDGGRRTLMCGPGRCHLPGGLRAWGWAVQLAITRSAASWGIGDLADLRDLAEWSASIGAGFVQVGPLVAPNPSTDPEPSPYYPSTRRFGNPLHIACTDLPGVRPAMDAALGELDRAGRALDRHVIVDRRRVAALKLAALERAWARGGFDRDAFASWRAARGPALERWSAYVVLAERHGTPDWRRWPADVRRPDASGVRRIHAEMADRVAFHAWVQWCFDLQLGRASTPLPIIADVPVGFDPGGFDAWDWQDLLADGMTIGVPPDRFNPAGQDWGMPAFHPHRSRAAGYAPIIETVRSHLRHARGLRIDHVLGLFRQWWIPEAAGHLAGAYVRQPTDELLEILAIESTRTGALVIGEDLGTVPPGVRPELRRRRILSTRLVYFERRPPAAYPRHVVAAVTTHDLPTVAGTWDGADLDDQAAAGLVPDAVGLARLRARLAAASGSGPRATLDEVTIRVHRALAMSPAALVAATLEDALRVPVRANIPGSVRSARENWSRALPVPVTELGSDRRVRSLVAALDRRRR